MLSLLSVSVITHNHEKYIKQAVLSTVSQKTDFSFEVVIGEDYSTDKTPVILDKLAKHYKNVKVFHHRKNLGMMPNFLATLSKCSGKYIALLDGDDYWIDKNKLQKQVDFMEKNPYFSMCCHNCLVKIESSKDMSIEWPGKKQKTVSTIQDRLREGSVAEASSLVFRNKVFGEFPSWFRTLSGGDWALQTLCASRGLIKYFPEVMGVYRQHTGGASHFEPGSQKHIDIFDKGGVQICKVLNRHFSYQYDHEIKTNLVNYFYPNLIKAYRLNGNSAGTIKFTWKLIIDSLALGRWPVFPK